jgi:hypothetical protein
MNKASKSRLVTLAELVASLLLTAIIAGLFYSIDTLPLLQPIPERPGLRR